MSSQVEIKFSLNTAPRNRNEGSAWSASIAPRSESGTLATCANSSGGSSYRFLSSGSPGSMRFWTPSSPASSIADYAMYGFAEASGVRNSRRFAFGLAEYVGIRIAAERFRAEYARLTGASNPGTRRLKLFVVGLQKQVSADACFKIPPIKKSAISLKPA